MVVMVLVTLVVQVVEEKVSQAQDQVAQDNNLLNLETQALMDSVMVVDQVVLVLHHKDKKLVVEEEVALEAVVLQEDQMVVRLEEKVVTLVWVQETAPLDKAVAEAVAAGHTDQVVVSVS